MFAAIIDTVKTAIRIKKRVYPTLGNNLEYNQNAAKG